MTPRIEALAREACHRIEPHPTHCGNCADIKHALRVISQESERAVAILRLALENILREIPHGAERHVPGDYPTHCNVCNERMPCDWAYVTAECETALLDKATTDPAKQARLEGEREGLRKAKAVAEVYAKRYILARDAARMNGLGTAEMSHESSAYATSEIAAEIEALIEEVGK